MGENTNTEPTNEDKDPKWYREQIEAEKAEKAQLKSQLVDQAFEMAGINPTAGLGKTMREMYGSVGGEPTKAAVLTFAKEKFEYEPPPAAQGSTPVQQIVNETVEQAQGRVDAATAAATPTDPPEGGDTLEARIAEAEKLAATSGDWGPVISLKNQKLARAFGVPGA